MDDVSSEFAGTEARYMINANHMQMCRYSSRDDDGYRQVSRELRRLCGEIEGSLEAEIDLRDQQR